MYEYKTPLRDFEFTYFEVMDYEKHLASLPKYADLDKDGWMSILEEFAKFAEGEIIPLYQAGDEGCKWEDGNVTTPAGFKEAYQKYYEAGWQALPFDPELGGMGLPESLNTNTMAIRGINWSWTSLIQFGRAAAPIFEKSATPEVRDMFLPKIATGEWLGTMCLTEPHCGTDLGLMKTKAVPNADGSYNITGTKIFITSGEHDLTDNIVHVVLARIEGAPAGVKGISLFAVAKNDLETGARNGVSCGSIEHKMGIRGSSTCVMNFDDAKGYLLGEPNRGLPTMFPMMNLARIGTGLQGVCHADIGYQQSVQYAKERLQSRSLSGPKNTEGPADPIIVHPDVRRMLLTQKAFTEGGRMFVAYCSKLLDRSMASDDPEVIANAEAKLSFLTPIIKAFLTETGFESANLALQIFGGHGFIQEWGVEQNVRDARISMLYEGTTGVQALDLLGRKVLASRGELMSAFVGDVENLLHEHRNHVHCQTLANYVRRWQEITRIVSERAASNPEEVGAASVDFLMMSGYIVVGYYWAKAVLAAEEALANGSTETEFYQSKVKTAQFYFDRLMPRIEMHAHNILSGADSLMDMTEDEFTAMM